MGRGGVFRSFTFSFYIQDVPWVEEGCSDQKDVLWFGAYSRPWVLGVVLFEV